MKEALEKLLISRIIEQDLKNDPLSFVHRYNHQRIRKLQGCLHLNWPMVGLLFFTSSKQFDIVDQDGGPRKWIEEFDVQKHSKLTNIKYRWNNPIDFVLMAHTLQKLLKSMTVSVLCSNNVNKNFKR